MGNDTDWEDGYHKSRYSYDVGACVEVREGAQTRIRDTENRGAGHLGFPAGEFSALLAAL
jgi:hypothetical protein